MARKPKMLNIFVTLDETKRIMHLFPERRGGQGISLSFSASLFRCVIRQVEQSKNGKFTSNYKASRTDFETQISLRR